MQPDSERAVKIRAGLAVLIVACSTAVFSAEREIEGRLCLGSTVAELSGNNCTGARGETPKVAPAERDRSFVWFSKTGQDVVLGVIPALDSTADLRPKAALKFEAISSSPRWPADLTVTVRLADGGRAWSVRWPKKEASKPHRVSLPAGRYEIELAATRHRVAIKPSIDAGSKVIDLGRIALEGIPLLSGRVIDGQTREPLPGAFLLLADEKLLGTTDLTGRFAIDVTGDWPELIRVVHEGHGTAVLDVPEARADAEFPTIEMGKGGVVRAIVSEIAAYNDEISLSLLLPGKEQKLIAQKQLPGGGSEVRYEALEPGRYLLLLRGKGPLQQFLRPVSVEAGVTTDVHLDVESRSLEVKVFLGEEGLSGAKISFWHTSARWEGSLSTDSDGEVTTELWQPGQFLTGVTSPEVVSVFMVLHRAEAGDPINLTIRLPDRKVFGQVLEATTGAPIADADVGLYTKSGDMTRSVGARSDASGRFEFRSAAAGQQSLTARAEGYLESRPLEFVLAEGDKVYEAPIRLSSSAGRTVAVVNAAGLPVGNATVVEMGVGVLRGIHVTDSGGTVIVQIPPGESRSLYIVPREGSFAIASIPAQRRSEPGQPVRVVVPAASASLDLSTRSSAGEPIPNVSFLLRFNGEVLPLEVIQVLERVQGLKLSTGPSGRVRLNPLPLGFYELWPVGTFAEARQVLANLGPTAPVQVELKPGENAAVLSFSANASKSGG